MFPAGWSGANHDNIVNLFLHHLTYTSLLILSYYYDATFAYIDLTSGDFSLLAAIACRSILNCSCAAISPLDFGIRRSASLMIIFSFMLDKVVFFRFLLLCMYIVYKNQLLFRSEVRHN